MAMEVLIRIAENSRRGKAIQRMALKQNATPQQVVERIIDAEIDNQAGADEPIVDGKTPAERLIGLFSSPEDASLIDEVTALAYEGRAAGSTRDIGL